MTLWRLVEYKILDELMPEKLPNWLKVAKSE